MRNPYLGNNWKSECMIAKNEGGDGFKALQWTPGGLVQICEGETYNECRKRAETLGYKVITT